jgi:ferredoxin
MCRFCTEHGDGRRWYLEASNYAADLTSDLGRRGYIVEFARTFDERMPRNLRLLDMISRAPGPLRTAASRFTTRRMRTWHFGQPVPIEECEEIFSFSTSIVQMPCVCRHFAKTPEEGYCIGVTATPADGMGIGAYESTIEDAFADYRGGPDVSPLQKLTATQATELLRSCEEKGLMHSVWTFKTPFIAAICNCDLPSGCMAMRTTVGYGVKLMWKGEAVAQLAEERCTGCGACVTRCPFGALSKSAREVGATWRTALDQTACYGCGVCRSACREGALSLVDRVSVPAVAADW